MKYKAKDTFELKNIAGDNLLIPRGEGALDFGALIVFNETGTLLWQAMTEFVTRDELVAVLIEKYGIEQAVAQQDVDAYLEKMSDSQLIETAD